MSELETIWKDFRDLSPLTEPYRIHQIPDHLRQRGAIFAFEGSAIVEGQTILLQVGLDRDFPQSLPMVILMPWHTLGFIPHVDKRGTVCYAQGEGLLLNRHTPVCILKEAVERSLRILAEGVRGENKSDFVDEFESYWARLDKVKTIPSAVEPSTTVEKITAIVDPDQPEGRPLCLTSDPGIVEAYLGLESSRNYVHRTALYIPFEEDVFIQPPRFDKFWGLSQIQEIVKSNLSSKNYKKLTRLSRKCRGAHAAVFHLPRPDGNAAMFGIYFSGVKHCSPLVPDGKAVGWVPFLLDRRDQEYLLPRGGANLQLSQKHVAVLGCGSVGGFLALELARSGIRKLSLVDPELLAPDNTFRHVLGRSSWCHSKSIALKEEIENKLPYISVQAFQDRAEEVIRNSEDKLRGCDLVISAIGNDTINLHLNQLLYEQPSAPPIIFTWLEPYGIGGHALLTGNSRGSGCLECLFTPAQGDDDYSLHNRAAFAAEGQFFGKTVSGCSDLFTPYGASDAVRTATLAVDLAIDTLLEREKGNPLVSWKGPADQFREAGFRLSTRYAMTEQELFERRYDYETPHCAICGSRT